ncbi:MAG: hypothetical protein AB7P99_04095 [Vicinamibacterales bacterium]
MIIHPRHAAVTAAAAVLVTVGVAAAQESGVRAVATVRQIMEGLIVPTSDVVFNVSDPPADDAAWARVEQQAALLAEGGNLLLLSAHAREGEVWGRSARALVDGAARASAAAHAKNVDALVEASDGVYTTCVTCHEQYLPKP